MKLLRLGIVFFCIVLLSACSNSQSQPQDDEQVAQVKLNEAAALNTQLGLTYINQNNMVLAKKKLLLALQQDPGLVQANSAMAYYFELTGDNKSAEQYYLKAIDLAKNPGGPDNNYGTFLCRQERYKEADEYFQKAINDKTYVNTAKAYENAGVCANLAGKQTVAKDYFQKAIKADPNLTTAMLQLAKLNYVTHDYAAAYQQIQAYLKAVQQPNAATLWLAIQLAKAVGDTNGAASYGALLAKQFPNSKEYQQYLNMTQ